LSALRGRGAVQAGTHEVAARRAGSTGCSERWTNRCPHREITDPVTARRRKLLVAFGIGMAFPKPNSRAAGRTRRVGAVEPMSEHRDLLRIASAGDEALVDVRAVDARRPDRERIGAARPRFSYASLQIGGRLSRNALIPSCPSAAIEFIAMTDFVRSYARCSSSSIWL